MRYTKKQLLTDVAKEVEAIKTNATAQEIAKLDIENFNGRHYKQCLYGQMTGDCFSHRASELIFECCSRFFVGHPDDKDDGLEEATEKKDSAVYQYANGEKYPDAEDVDTLNYERNNGVIHYSSIEAYIMLKSAKPANIIAYLKGEMKDLVL
jgi:hypothetical protein